MGQARDEAGNIWETDAQGNPVRLIKSATGRAGMLTDPYKPAEEAREERRTASTEQNAATAAANAARAATASENANTIAQARLKADLAKEGKMMDAAGNIVPLPGFSAGGQRVNPDRTAQIKTILGTLSRLRELAGENLATGAGINTTLREWLPLDQNRKNLEGALAQLEGDMIQQQLMLLAEANKGGVSGLANSETEAKRLAGSIANLSPDQDYAEFLRGLDKAEDYYLRQAGRYEGVQGVDANLIGKYLPEKDREAALARLGVAPQGAAGGGATQQSVPLPPEMQAEMQAWFADNPELDPGKYAAFRNALNTKYGFGTNPEEELRGWAETARTNRAKGVPIPTQIPPATTPLEGFDAIRNEVAASAPGAFAAGALNAGGFGIPQLLAGDQYAAMRDLNPGSAIGGEILGGITGTMLGGGVLNQVSRAGGLSPTAARVLSNPLTADVGYGSIYGATTADDPLYGAVVGGTSALVGNKAGNAIGKRLPRVFGVKPAADTLSGGERAIVNSMDMPNVQSSIDQLQQGADLGVPLSLADVSRPVNALAGSAIRHNPTAADPVVEALVGRAGGRHDRLRGAIERDLGPITNIPERTDELFKTASRNAGPLYEQAYSAPGIEDLDIADLLARPSVQQALPGARRIALEEGLNPDEMGFVLNAAGDVEVPGFGRYAEARGPMPASPQSVVSGAGKNAPDDLVTFVRRNGGLSDFGGELKFMDVKNAPRRGVGMAGSDAKAGRLIDNDRGLDFDEMAERAWEAGYFGPPDSTPRPTVREFLDAFENNYRGEARTFSIYDDAKVADYNAAADARQSWEAMGPDDVYDTSAPAGMNDVPFMPPEAMGDIAPIMPTWRTLDYVKRGLDDVVEGKRDTFGKLDTEGRAVNQTRADLLGVLDTANPAYGEARAAWAGPVQEAERLRRAKEFLQMSPDELNFEVKGYSPDQQAVARLGIQSDLADRVGRTRGNANPFGQVLGQERIGDQLGALYPEDNVARLLLQRDLEAQLANSQQRLIGNSMTQERAVADQAFKSGGLGADIGAAAVESLATGGIPVGAVARTGIRGLMRQSAEEKAAKQAAALAGEILPIATNPDPRATIATIQDLAARDEQYRALAELLLGQAATRGGHVVGGMAGAGSVQGMR